MTDMKSLLQKPEFPRSAKYDPDWMMDNQMEPNAPWLLETLCESLDLKPGMRPGSLQGFWGWRWWISIIGGSRCQSGSGS